MSNFVGREIAHYKSRYVHGQGCYFMPLAIGDQWKCLFRTLSVVLLWSSAQIFSTIAWAEVSHPIPSSTDIEQLCDDQHPQKISFKKEVRGRGQWRYDSGPSGWEGHLLNQVTLHCEHPRCLDDQYRANILRASHFPLYQNLDVKRLETAWGRLMQIDMFAPESYLIVIQPKHTHTSDHGDDAKDGHHDTESGKSNRPLNHTLALRLCLTMRPIVDSIDVHYSSWSSVLYPKQFLTEIHKRLNLKRGGPFRDKPKELREQEAHISASYARIGYRNVNVKIISTPIESKPNHVKIDIHITEGEQPRLKIPVVRILDERLTLDERIELTRRVHREVAPDLFFDVFTSFPHWTYR